MRGLQGAQKVPGQDRIYVAGEKEHERQELMRERGIPVNRNLRRDLQSVRDELGISRKYAVPLLETLDKKRITRRDGDVRSSTSAHRSNSVIGKSRRTASPLPGSLRLSCSTARRTAGPASASGSRNSQR